MFATTRIEFKDLPLEVLNGSDSYLFATSDPVAGQLRLPAWKKYVKRLSYPYLIPSIRCDVLALFFHLYD